MSSKYVDDIIIHKERDIEKIQTAPHMYISYTGKKGTLHLAKELVNNSIDEAINKESPANTINIFYDERTGSFISRDNGRGIQFDMLEIACSNIQAGSKFGRKGTGGTSAGQNGVGTTAVNALSEVFIITSYRANGEKRTIEFNNGNKISDTVEKCKKSEHGLRVEFVPSKKFMGKKCFIETSSLVEWLTKISYLLPHGIVINLNIERIGKASSMHVVYKNKDGMYTYLKDNGKGLIFNPIHLKDSTNIGIVGLDDKIIDRFLGLEIAFSLSSEDIPFKDVFCNFINNIDGGTHMKAVEDAIGYLILRKTKESLSDKEKTKLDIRLIDVMSNLSLSVNVMTDIDPEFSGQTKEKATSEAFVKPIKNMATSQLKKYFKDNPKELKKCIDFVKNVAKARYESQKVRNSVIRGKDSSSLDEHRIKHYVPAINKKGKELFILEGDSALGSARSARNPYTQALLAFRGVPSNTVKKDLVKSLENPEIRALVTILGTNIGIKFDIRKLKFDKIIIMTDGDIDGCNITSTLCGFFIKHMPELVKHGKLYKALPPLYKLKSKEFVNDKKSYVKLMEERISRCVKVYDMNGNQLNRAEVQSLLLRNRLYPETLTRTANNLTVDPLFIEFLVRHFTDKKFKKMLKANFPEIKIEEENDSVFISGIANDTRQSIVLNKRYYKRTDDLRKFIFDVNDGNIYYRIVEIDKHHGDIDRGVVSLGGLFKLTMKHRPSIDIRYKGLGELPPKELWDTTMNPLSRTIMRMSMQDLQRELDIFEMLHGKNDGNKSMIENYKIALEDLDN